MAADGQVKIALELEDNLNTELPKAIDSVKNAGDKIEAQAKESNQLVRREAEKTREELDRKFGKATRVKLVADADKQGIKNFDLLLKELPKKKQTELLAKAQKGEVINYEKELRKVPAKIVSKAELSDHASEGLRGLKRETTSLQKEATETGHRFKRLKDIMIGSFVGSAVTSGIFAITNGLHEAAKAGLEYDKVQDTMKTNWKALTTEAPRDGKEMISFINNLSQHSIYSADSIDKMAQSFYHINSNAPNAKKWAQDFVNLGSTLHVSNDALRESGEQFSKIVAGGKASQEDMNVMINRFPMFGEALEKASGKSMKQLQEMSSKGQLSAKQFTDALDYLGKKYKDSQEEALNSAQGMGMYLRSRLSKLSGDVMKSSFNMSKSTLGAIKEITSDKSMETYSKGISAGIGSMTTTLAHFIEYIAKHQKDIVGIFGSIKDIAGALIGGAWDSAKATISSIADVFGKLGGNAKKSHDPLKNINSILKDIAKHKDAIRVLGSVLAAAFAVKKLAGFADGIRNINDSLKVTSSMKKIGGLFIKPKVDGSDAKRELGILGKAIKGTGKGIGKALKWTAKISTKAAIAAMSGLKKAAQVTGSGMKAAFNFAKANPILLIISAIVALGVAFYELYKHNKKFRNFVNGIGKAISSFFKSAGKTIDKGIKSIKNTFKGIIKFFKKDWKEVLLLIVNPFSGAFALLYKHNKKFRDGVNGLISWFKKNLSSFGKWLSKTWRNIWNPIVDFFEDVWNNIKRIASRAWDWISDHINGFGKSIRNIWHNTWNAVSDFFNDTWNNIKGVGRNAWNWIANKMDNFGDNVSKGWKSLWNGLKDFFGDIWNGIKKTASDGMNAVIGFINKGIGGINSVIHTFGGSKHAIHEVPKFAKGTKGAPSGLAMVNDGNGEELIIDKQGNPHVLEGRNRLVAFSGGETVIPHEDTKTLFGGSIPHFAKGTPNWFEGITDWVKDKWDSLKNFIKHPLKAVGGIMNNAIKGVASNSPEFVKKITPPLGNQFVKSITSPITSLFKKLNSKHEDDMGDAGGSHGNPSGAGVQRWRGLVKKALEANGLSTSTSMIEKVLRQIATESGGNPKVTQGGADPDGDGSGPAMGLMQTKRATFLANAFPGHHDIFNGYDSLLSGLHYAKGRYGSDLSFLGNGHGYANGGWANQASIFGEVPGEPEVAINPKRPTADKLLLEAAQATAKKQPNSLMAKMIMQAEIAKKSLQSGHNVNQPLGAGSNTLQSSSYQKVKNGDLVVEVNLDGRQIGHAVSPIIEALHDQKMTVQANAMGLGGNLNYGI
ncbi:tape measure protein [Weissella viridescens]|uniref:tape measure protein n=2 Tax=Weissella TaxID=46255 RepID=UPI003527C6AB